MELGNRIVFVGDSITEWGRNEDPEDIGSGYVKLIHDYLKTTYPEKELSFFNRGVGGDRITDLEVRWKKDVIELNPDIVSISIGINDVWRQLDHPDLEQVTPEKFESIYKKLIEQTKLTTKAEIILMEPTIIEEEIGSKGNEKLKEYVNIINNLGSEYEWKVVPTHKAFIKYLEANSNYKLTIDGVHMNPAGNMLMAKTWLKTLI